MSRSIRRQAGNLPEETTRFIGRRAELVAIRGLLSTSRLVTLTGPGGVGKTRLALEVARKLRSGFLDGTWVAALDELNQPDLLPAALMSVAGSAGRPGSRIDDLIALVGDQRMLFVLDNCEHLAQECASLATELLRRCPGLKLLATSQVPLGVDGETIFSVPPLSLPQSEQPEQSEQPAEPAVAATVSEAVALFVDRAMLASPGWSMSLADEQQVVALCRQLDGLPLAIELAAAATRHFPLAMLVTQVRDRLQIPLSGSRSAPERQRTLLTSLDHSYEFCSPDAKELWGRLSVFRGGADLEAVHQVGQVDGEPSVRLHAALAELVDKSVVTFDGSRYRMLDTLRRYGSLVMGDEQRSVRRAHRDHYLKLAELLDADWFGGDQSALISRVATEQANIRAAMEFCLEAPSEVTAGLRLASSLWAFWVSRGLPGEGKRWLDGLLAADDHPCPERVAGLWVDGILTALEGDVSASLVLAEEGRRLAEQLDDRRGLAHATMAKGFAEVVGDRLEAGVADLESAVALQRRLTPPSPHLATALGELGCALCYGGALERAVPILEEAKALSEATGEQLLLSWAISYLGLEALLDGRPLDAGRLLRDALAKKRAIQDHIGMNVVVELLSWAALDADDTDQAVRLLGASEVMTHPAVPHLVSYGRLLGWHSDHKSRACERIGPAAFQAAFDAGRRMTPVDAVSYALGERSSAEPDDTDPLARLPLTPREKEVASLLAAGRTNRQIAEELVIAHRTADTHVENILTKLGLSSRKQVETLLSTA